MSVKNCFVLIALALITLSNISITQGHIRHPIVLKEASDKHQEVEKKERPWADVHIRSECNLNYAEKKNRIERDDEESDDARKMAEEEELKRQLHLEKFKGDFLRRLHLSEPPNFGWHGGLTNRTLGRRVLRSLPLALQGRIFNQMRAEDGATEPLPDRTDERETLILLKPLKWKLFNAASAIFAIEVADDIDASGIYSALLQFETMNPALKGQRLEVWEAFMTSDEMKNKEEFVNKTEDRYTNLTKLFEQQSSDYKSLLVPTQLRDPLDSTGEQMQSGFIRIRPNLLAETFVPDRPRLVQVTFEISAALYQWMHYKQQNTLMPRLIRSILVVCPKCDRHADPVDVNKGILEIRYRNGVRRSRRSLDSNSRHQVTIKNRCGQKGHKFSCCTQPLTLNFEDAGWSNWIVHPKTVQPNYCRGSCQTDGIGKTTHFNLMDLYRNQYSNQLTNVEKDAMLSRCHPVRMASASVLYLDPEMGIQMRTLQNFIVLECGCS